MHFRVFCLNLGFKVKDKWTAIRWKEGKMRF